MRFCFSLLPVLPLSELLAALFIWRRRERRKTCATYQLKNASSGLLAVINACVEARAAVRYRAFPDRLILHRSLRFFLLTFPVFFFEETRSRWRTIRVGNILAGFACVSCMHTYVCVCKCASNVSKSRNEGYRYRAVVNFQTIISQQCRWLPLQGNPVAAIATLSSQSVALNLISKSLGRHACVDRSISIV